MPDVPDVPDHFWEFIEGGDFTKFANAESEAGAEEAIRDWWYLGRKQTMTSKRAAQSLIWHLAKCGLHIVRKL
jgi:hypothetical protein